MLELLGKLNARIAELNDGSFVVDDRETPRIIDVALADNPIGTGRPRCWARIRL